MSHCMNMLIESMAWFFLNFYQTVIHWDNHVRFVLKLANANFENITFFHLLHEEFSLSFVPIFNYEQVYALMQFWLSLSLTLSDVAGKWYSIVMVYVCVNACCLGTSRRPPLVFWSVSLRWRLIGSLQLFSALRSVFYFWNISCFNSLFYVEPIDSNTCVTLTFTFWWLSKSLKRCKCDFGVKHF